MENSRVKSWGLFSLKTIKSLTLVELMVSVMIVGMMIVGFYGFETFTNTQVIDSDRRAKVQNQLSYCLEHMSKYIQRANGDTSNPPIKLYPNAGPPYTGFQVRFDCNATQTPSVLTDDVWIYYTLAGNNLSVGSTGGCALVPAEVLATKILDNFSNTVLPFYPAPTAGFYVVVDAGGNLVNIALVGRYDPTRPVDSGTSFVNPQVEAKTRIICNSSSSL